MAERTRQNRKTKGRDQPTGNGRPRYEPNERDRTVVAVMVAAGVQQKVIGAALGIDDKTLTKYYRAEIDTAGVQANAKVVASLFKAATDSSNVRAMEFWLTNRDKKNWAHTQKVAVDQQVTNNLGDRLKRAQASLKTKG